VEVLHSNSHFQKALFFFKKMHFFPLVRLLALFSLVFTKVTKVRHCVLCSLMFLCCLDFGVWIIKFF
jgi:hypothetical protein